tara:strand:- start:5242 stop:7695 length:2454 start_codon:yes stop_codon:yes gene_type:complete
VLKFFSNSQQKANSLHISFIKMSNLNGEVLRGMPTVQLVDLFAQLAYHIFKAQVDGGERPPFRITQQKRVTGQGLQMVTRDAKPNEIMVAVMTDASRPFDISLRTASLGFITSMQVSKALIESSKVPNAPYFNGAKNFDERPGYMNDAKISQEVKNFAVEIEAERGSILNAVNKMLNTPQRLTPAAGSQPEVVATGAQILSDGRYFPDAPASGNDGPAKGSSLDRLLTRNFKWAKGLTTGQTTAAMRVAAIRAVLAVTTAAKPEAPAGAAGGVGVKKPFSVQNVQYVAAQSSGILVREIKALIASLARADKTNTEEAAKTMNERQQIAAVVRAKLGFAAQSAPSPDAVLAAMDQVFANNGSAYHAFLRETAGNVGGAAGLKDLIWKSINQSRLALLTKGNLINKTDVDDGRGGTKKMFLYDPMARVVPAGGNMTAQEASRFVFESLMDAYFAKGQTGVDKLTDEADKRSQTRTATGASGFYGVNHPVVTDFVKEQSISNTQTVVSHVGKDDFTLAALKVIASAMDIKGQEDALMRTAVEAAIMDKIIRLSLPAAENDDLGAIYLVLTALKITGFNKIMKDGSLLVPAKRAIFLKMNAHYGILEEDCSDAFVAGKGGVLSADDLKNVLKARTVVASGTGTVASLCQLIKAGGLSNSGPQRLSGRREEQASKRAPTSGKRSGSRGTTQARIVLPSLNSVSAASTSPRASSTLNNLANQQVQQPFGGQQAAVGGFGGQQSAVGGFGGAGSLNAPAVRTSPSKSVAFNRSPQGTRLSPLGQTRLSPGGTRGFGAVSPNGTQQYFNYPRQQANADAFNDFEI